MVREFWMVSKVGWNEDDMMRSELSWWVDEVRRVRKGLCLIPHEEAEARGG